MTTEREEVIDFVAPYFDQSGISILIRKKAPERNMFKFMTVLRPEVWYGILGAVVGKHLCKENLIKIVLQFFFFYSRIDINLGSGSVFPLLILQ